MAKKITKKVKPQKIIKRAQRQQHQLQTQQTEQKKYEIPKGTYVEAVGRRKVASARVRIYETKDAQYIVNDQLATDYFKGIPLAVKIFQKPFELTGTKDKFSVTAMVDGSGIRAQLDAVVHGISRALVEFDPSFKPFLKAEGMLSRDDRLKETRKPGRGGRARAKRQSPKR